MAAVETAERKTSQYFTVEIISRCNVPIFCLFFPLDLGVDWKGSAPDESFPNRFRGLVNLEISCRNGRCMFLNGNVCQSYGKKNPWVFLSHGVFLVAFSLILCQFRRSSGFITRHEITSVVLYCRIFCSE